MALRECAPTVEFAGPSLVAVLSANLHRRHMSAGQQAAIVASAADWAKAQKHGGDRKSDRGAMLPLESVASRAAASNTSVRTQKDTDKVARADPGLAKKVGIGGVTLAAAKAKVEGKTRPPAKKWAKKAEPAPDVAELEAKVAELEEWGNGNAQNARELIEENAVSRSPVVRCSIDRCWMHC